MALIRRSIVQRSILLLLAVCVSHAFAQGWTEKVVGSGVDQLSTQEIEAQLEVSPIHGILNRTENKYSIVQ